MVYVYNKKPHFRKIIVVSIFIFSVQSYLDSSNWSSQKAVCAKAIGLMPNNLAIQRNVIISLLNEARFQKLSSVEINSVSYYYKNLKSKCLNNSPPMSCYYFLSGYLEISMAIEKSFHLIGFNLDNEEVLIAENNFKKMITNLEPNNYEVNFSAFQFYKQLGNGYLDIKALRQSVQKRRYLASVNLRIRKVLDVCLNEEKNEKSLELSVLFQEQRLLDRQSILSGFSELTSSHEILQKLQLCFFGRKNEVI